MKLGLVLSGGGARGIAHLGVIKALEEKGLTFDFISGTSAGAIVGSLYAQGYTPDEILKFTEDTSFIRHLRPALNLKGLIRMNGLSSMLANYLPHDSFEGLKIPMTIAATNINRGKPEYFNSGKLIKAILASACIPIIFNHITIDGVDYVDGGITDNFPIGPIRDKCDKVIGSHTNFIGNEFHDFNMKSLLERTMLIAISGNVYPKKELCDVFIDPPGLSNFTGFDLKKNRTIFQLGYDYTHTLFEENPSLASDLVGSPD